MNWQYLIGVVVVVLIALAFFAMGYLKGEDKHNSKRQEAFHNGYEAGKNDYPVVQPNALQERMQRADRTALPRPDSVGPIRVHRARVRGDHRLPQNQDEKGNRTS